MMRWACATWPRSYRAASRSALACSRSLSPSSRYIFANRSSVLSSAIGTFLHLHAEHGTYRGAKILPRRLQGVGNAMALVERNKPADIIAQGGLELIDVPLGHAAAPSRSGLEPRNNEARSSKSLCVARRTRPGT